MALLFFHLKVQELHLNRQYSFDISHWCFNSLDLYSQIQQFNQPIHISM